MRMSDSLAEKILQDAGVSNARILELKAEVKASHLPLAELILHYGTLDESTLTKAYAQAVNLPFISLPLSELDAAHLAVLPHQMAHRYRVVVFSIDKANKKLVASDALLMPGAAEVLAKTIGENYSLHITPPSHLHSALAMMPPGQLRTHPAITSKSYSEADILSTVHHILEQAITANATSIHIEPKQDALSVRFRLNGRLKEVHKLPYGSLNMIANRLKSMAGSQGQFRISSRHHIYRVELLSLPLIDGEKLTLNLFSENGQIPKLNSLGIYGTNLAAVEHSLTNKHGLVIVASPKRHGKNTALYSLLDKLSIANLNVLTIEDKVSYRVSGASQMELNSNLPTYEAALSLVKRNDPDVLLIDNIASPSVADELIGMSAHCLVLAGVHSPSALESLRVISALGVEPFRLAHVSRLTMATRVARRLCDDCKVVVHPTNQALKSLLMTLGVGEYGGIKALHRLEKIAANEKISSLKSNDLSTSETSLHRLWEASKNGCARCDYSGFKGQIGIQEILEIDQVIAAKLAAGESQANISKIAIKNNIFIPLGIDGLVKALRGLTTLDEVLSCL